MAGIFISYRREDTGGYAGRLADRLRGEFGSDRVFRDVEAMSPGQDFVDVLVDAIKNADVLIVLIGPHWTEEGRRRLKDPSDFVRLELMTALSADTPLIPVLVGGARPLTENDLPAELHALCRREAHEISERRWEYDVQQLVTALAVLGRRGLRVRRRWLRTAAIGAFATGGLVLAAVAYRAHVHIPPESPDESSTNPVRGELPVDGLRDNEAGSPSSAGSAEAKKLGVPDLAHVDVSGYLDTALRRAREEFPDAELNGFTAAGVFPDGHADLTLSDDVAVTYWFFSPSCRASVPAIPKGLPAKEDTCGFSVDLRKNMPQAYRGDSSHMTESIALPACTVKALWRKAARLGALGDNTVAQINYSTGDNGKPEWSFEVGEMGRDFNRNFADGDCESGIPKASYDPRHFDVMGYLPTALGLAREHSPDAGLVELHARGVAKDGFVNLTEGDSFASYSFGSPSETTLKRDADADCGFEVSVDAKGVSAEPSAGDCDHHRVGGPKCSLQQLGLKVPAATTQFEVFFTANNAADERWALRDGDWSKEFADDCGSSSPTPIPPG